MYVYGLIGYPLSHSFSQQYFTEKFANEGCAGYSYRNFPISDIRELGDLLEQQPDLRGFNVTIPYKEQIIPFLDETDSVAAKTGAVNTVHVMRDGNRTYLKGYNTDVYGFSRSLEEWLNFVDAELPVQALVLGTGGASKAVACALAQLNVGVHLASRKERGDVYKTYDRLNAGDIAVHPLIVNTTPLGMFPNTGECPAIPYQYLTEKHYLYDLVYNPEETLFMRKGLAMGASVHNGKRMLHLQADQAWEIWKFHDSNKSSFKNPIYQMNHSLIFLVAGFEEIEALTIMDILRRGGAGVQSVSLAGDRTVVGGHQIPVVADCLFEEADFANAQMLILPGGTVKINEHDGLKREISAFAAQGKPIAAICAAPMVLGELGLLNCRKATCYPGYEQYLAGAYVTGAPVTVDGNITTGRAAGYTLEFALELLSQLRGKDIAKDVKQKVLPK